MDLIDRLVEHGRWFSRYFLDAARPLTDEQLDRPFDIGHGTLRKTAVHLVNVVEAETARLRGVAPPDRLPDDAAIADVIAAHEAAFARFRAAADDLLAAGRERQDATYTDNYGIPQSYGGTLLFVITQNVQRIAELRHFLVRLGVDGLMDGDVQEWEHFSGLIDRFGGQYPEGFVRPWA